MRPTGADVADSSETDIGVTDTYVGLIYIYIMCTLYRAHTYVYIDAL